MIRSTIRKFIKEKIYYRYLNRRGFFRFFGETVFFSKGSLSFEDVMKNGVYELDNIGFVQGNIIDGSTYLDIGGNIGLMSIPILKQFKSTKVVSIEASPNTFGYLKRTWEDSSVKDRWHLINSPISDIEGDQIDFYTSDSKNHAYESMRDTSRINFTEVIKLTTTTIDRIWIDLGKPTVSFIKSDIEGADLLALRGGKKCIEVCSPTILLEWNQQNIKPFGFKNTDLLLLCVEIGYRCYSLPYLNYISTDNELFQNALTTESFLLVPNDR